MALTFRGPNTNHYQSAGNFGGPAIAHRRRNLSLFPSSSSSKCANGGASIGATKNNAHCSTSSSSSVVERRPHNPRPNRQLFNDPQNNPWMKEAKIPITMNMSTLIRKQNNAEARQREMRDNAGELFTGNANYESRPSRETLLVTTGVSPNSRIMTPNRPNRRMFDYMMQKFDSINAANSYARSQFLKMVANNAAAAAAGDQKGAPAANAGGDSIALQGVYERVAAISLQDPHSGRNLQYVEKISIQSQNGAMASVVVPSAKLNGQNDVTSATTATRYISGDAKPTKLVICHPQSVPSVVSLHVDNALPPPSSEGPAKIVELDDQEITKANKMSGAGDEGDVSEEEKIGNRASLSASRVKKKLKKRLVVTTSLKNCSIKYVRRSG